MTTALNPVNNHSVSSSISPKSQCVIVACVVGGIAGVVIMALSGTQIFGALGSSNFMASMVGGGVLTSVAVVGILVIAIPSCKGNSPDVVEGSQSKAPSAVKEQQQDLAQLTRQYDEKKARFQAQLQQRLQEKTIASDQHVFPVSDASFQDKIDELGGWWDYDHGQPDHIHKFAGGVHRCLTTTKVPDYVFKCKIASCEPNYCEQYQEKTQRAQKICKDYNLYLLEVPPCQIVTIRQQPVIMQQKLTLVSPKWEGQEACYQWLWNNPETRDCMKELFRQLMIFVYYVGFGDVKYDNLNMTESGRVALFDLDDGGWLQGFVSGGAGDGQGGLFNMIPLWYLNEYRVQAEKLLQPAEYKRLEVVLSKLEERAQKREERSTKICEFHTRKQIVAPNQLLKYDQKPADKSIRLCVDMIIEACNQQISQLDQLGMATGRTIKIQAGMYDDIPQRYAKDPKGQKFQNFLGFRAGILEPAAKFLNSSGIVFSCEFDDTYNTFTIIC